MQASCCICLISCLSQWTVLELGSVNPWIAINFLGSLFLGIPYGILPSRFPKRLESPHRVQCCDPAFCPSPSPVMNPTISWSMQPRLNATDLHVPRQPFHVFKYQVQQSASEIALACRTLLSMCPRNLLDCCIVLQKNTEVDTILHEHQGLRMWGFFQLSEGGLIYITFL